MTEARDIAERRRQTRIPCEFSDAVDQTIRNMSGAGLYFESLHRYQPNESIPISFVLPTTGRPLRLKAKIVHEQPVRENRYGYGVQFEKLEETDRELLRHFLKTETIYAKVREVFAQVLPDGAKREIPRDASVVRDLHIDSLKVAELSILLEQAFRQSLFLPDWLTSKEDPEDLTVNSLVSFLAENLRSLP